MTLSKKERKKRSSKYNNRKQLSKDLADRLECWPGLPQACKSQREVISYGDLTLVSENCLEGFI